MGKTGKKELIYEKISEEENIRSIKKTAIQKYTRNRIMQKIIVIIKRNKNKYVCLSVDLI